MIGQIITLTWWVVLVALVHRIAAVRSWDETIGEWVDHCWYQIRGWFGDDLPEVATWLGVVLIGSGIARWGWAGAVALAIGAACVGVAVRVIRDERSEQARRIEEAVARTRHDAVVEGVAAEMVKVRSALGGAVSQFAGLLDEAIEEILDTP